MTLSPGRTMSEFSADSDRDAALAAADGREVVLFTTAGPGLGRVERGQFVDEAGAPVAPDTVYEFRAWAPTAEPGRADEIRWVNGIGRCHVIAGAGDTACWLGRQRYRMVTGEVLHTVEVFQAVRHGNVVLIDEIIARRAAS